MKSNCNLMTRVYNVNQERGNKMKRAELKAFRMSKGFTQKDVAEMLGINSVTYLHYEKEHREPPLSLLADMAKLYGVSVDFLLGLKDY